MKLAELQQQNQQLIDENEQLSVCLKERQNQHLKVISDKDKELKAKGQELEVKDSELQKQKRLNDQLMELLAQMKQQRFGSSSEKVSPDQLSLFDEAEASVEEMESIAEATTTEVKSHTRKKGGRAPLPADLPREEIIHDLEESDKVCPHDGTELKAIGEETSEQLDIIPAQVKVIRHIRKKYACPCCDGYVVTASKPKQPIEKAIASPGLLAYIITSKYQDSLPLYRQESIFQRIGVDLKRHTLAQWMIQCGQLIQPLINEISDRIREQPVMYMDETTVQVLKPSEGTTQRKRYMWVQKASPPDSKESYVLFHYADNRSGTVAQQLVQDFQGALMVDGYSGYSVINDPGIIRLGCWAHARRKFVEAKQVQPKGKTGKADQALAWIQKLYAIEKQLNNLKSELERRAYRQQHAQPVLDKMKAWTDKSLLTTPPKMALGKALVYLSNQWIYLVRYLDNGNYPIDNNTAENAIRPFVIGRKNWLFSNSEAGAKASANLYSLIETAKAHQVEPYHYLRWVLAELPLLETMEQVDRLLPDQFQSEQGAVN